MAYRDIVIIGSGFGGAVMAARLGRYVADAHPGRYRVHLIEKGNDNTGRFDPESDGPPLSAQGNRFRHTLAPDYLAEIGDVFTDTSGSYTPGIPSMNVVAGKGLGGGSLLYDGVSLRAPTEIFEQSRGGRRLWPSAYSRAALDPYFERAEQELSVHRMRWTDAEVPHWQLATKRDFVFAEGCRRIGATATPLKVADRDDHNEGWWNQGQRFEGRQDLTKNYLQHALDAGVTFWTGCEVQDIAPTAGGYVVRGIDARQGRDQPFELECRILIMAAGCVATTGLLLRSRDNFEGERALDPGDRDGQATLGRHLSSNGDYGVTGIIGKDFELDVEGQKGKPMSSFCPSFWRQHQFILIPFYAAPLYFSLGQISTLLPAERPDAVGRASTRVARGAGGRPVPDWGLGYKERLKLFSSRMMTMGCLALDACEGEIRLGADDDNRRYEVRWRETDAETEQRWSAAVDSMRRIYEALGGELYLDGYRKDGVVNSSHPLGGCRMADFGEAEVGVVDPNGEAFTNPNLFVVDGGIIPSALGVNPSLTIAAVAERIADRLITGEETASLAERLAAP